MAALKREIHKLRLAEFDIEVERRRVRNLYLRVHITTGRIRLVAPVWVGRSVVEQFASGRIDWLRRQLQRVAPAGTQLPLALSNPAPGAGERARMRTQVLALLPHWEQRMGVNCRGLHLRHMRSRWGSCNPRTGQIRLNTELLRRPPECLEYVLVHELVHLLEPSHNARFHALMDRFLPQWRGLRARLREI